MTDKTMTDDEKSEMKNDFDIVLEALQWSQRFLQHFVKPDKCIRLIGGDMRSAQQHFDSFVGAVEALRRLNKPEPDGMTLPELQEGWEYTAIQLYNESNLTAPALYLERKRLGLEETKWAVTVAGEFSAFTTLGPTPRAAALAAIEKIENNNEEPDIYLDTDDLCPACGQTDCFSCEGVHRRKEY